MSFQNAPIDPTRVEIRETDILGAVRPLKETLVGLKPIPTLFNNVLFRSRLEARWAVFLTSLKINWEYEHEGFDLNGIWYLPDFYLPDWNGGTFIEVKPKKLSKNEQHKARLLCELSGHPVFIAVGSPDLKLYEIYTTQWYQQFHQIDLCYTNFAINWKSEKEVRFWLEYEPFAVLKPTNYPELTAAVKTAKSYRF